MGTCDRQANVTAGEGEKELKKKVKRPAIFLIVVAFFFLDGCIHGPSSVLDPKRPSADVIPKEIIRTESNKLGTIQKELVETLEEKAPREVQVEPMMPEYDPLDDQIVSFSMVNEDLQLMLYTLSQAVGMNLIIDPNVSEEKRLVTLNFEKAPASTVLKEVLGSFDLYYEVEQNVIRVRSYDERIFKLNFLDATVNTAFDVGGDVLGAAETETATGLSGNFKLTGRGAKKGNPYDLVEEMIKGMLSEGGKSSLNRLSGSLYVKDRPAVIRSIARLVNHLKDMLARQILIEARIIEVTLSDEYAYGIDWSVVRDKSSSGSRYSSVAWGLGTGLVLSHVDRYMTVNATLDALKTFGDTKIVSNPSIRCKHSQPAIISVGTSFTYKKNVTTTLVDRDSRTEESTEVEVSSVFDGLVLGVIPFIEEDGRITLLINPIKSDVDPISIQPEAVAGGGNASISLPSVSIKEISTTIGVNSGDVVILGGLIDKRRQTEKKGVPILSSIPLLGYLFKHDTVTQTTRELVIVLTVSMI